MKTVFHPAGSRGHADHGWLDTRHTFSFAGYHNQERMNFGVLRVLNDDIVAPSMGFGTHPHSNMEIVSIPLQGALRHKDSMGNQHVIRSGEVQIMSAGTGIAHSEYNDSNRETVNFLQIWVFPKHHNIQPRYSQVAFNPEDRHNIWQTVVAPKGEDVVNINQDAWFSMTDLDAGKSVSYKRKQSGNGMYLFLLEGEIEVEEGAPRLRSVHNQDHESARHEVDGQCPPRRKAQVLTRRDGLGIWEADEISVTANQNARVLLMEVPMSLS